MKKKFGVGSAVGFAFLKLRSDRRRLGERKDKSSLIHIGTRNHLSFVAKIFQDQELKRFETDTMRICENPSVR